MHFLFRLFLIFSAGLCLLSNPVLSAGPKLPVMHAQPKAWIVIDGASGYVMASSSAEKEIDPGDLVQLMTLFTALEIIGDDKEKLQAPVTISAQDSLRPLSSRRLYLVAGETTPLKTLLNGIAVVAAEDASLAVAAHLAGSVEAFVEKMNATARAIGMTNSRFVSPIAAQNQRTSAKDLAVLAVEMHRRHP